MDRAAAGGTQGGGPHRTSPPPTPPAAMPPLRVLAKPWALLPLSGTLSALAAMALCLALVYTNTQATHEDAPLSRARPSPSAAAPVLLATAAYVCLYYAFLFGQSLVTGVAFYTMYGDEKRANPSAKPTITLFDVKYRNPPDAVILANRVVGNTLEQAFPFVVGLWLHAFYLCVPR